MQIREPAPWRLENVNFCADPSCENMDKVQCKLTWFPVELYEFHPSEWVCQWVAEHCFQNSFETLPDRTCQLAHKRRPANEFRQPNIFATQFFSILQESEVHCPTFARITGQLASGGELHLNKVHTAKVLPWNWEICHAAVEWNRECSLQQRKSQLVRTKHWCGSSSMFFLAECKHQMFATEHRTSSLNQGRNH